MILAIIVLCYFFVSKKGLLCIQELLTVLDLLQTDQDHLTLMREPTLPHRTHIPLDQSFCRNIICKTNNRFYERFALFVWTYLTRNKFPFQVNIQYLQNISPSGESLHNVESSGRLHSRQVKHFLWKTFSLDSIFSAWNTWPINIIRLLWSRKIVIPVDLWVQLQNQYDMRLAHLRI